MSLFEAEEALFAEWRERHANEGRAGQVATDGAADPAAYEASSPRLLFLLKEVNDPEGGFDLRAFLREGGRPQTWNNVARWVIGLRAWRSEMPWRALEQVTPEMRQEALRTIAAVNLKKEPGTYVSDNDLLAVAVERDRDLLRRQIALYRADITVCCGSVVGDALYRIADLGAWKTTSRGIWYVQGPDVGTAIWFSHPMARVQAPLLCYGLVDAVREIWASDKSGQPYD